MMRSRPSASISPISLPRRALAKRLISLIASLSDSYRLKHESGRSRRCYLLNARGVSSGSRRNHPPCTCASRAIPAPERRPLLCGWRRSCIGSGMHGAIMSSASHATISLASTSVTRHQKRKRYSKRRWAAYCLSTRPTTSIDPKTSATTARRQSKFSSRSWRITAMILW